MAPFRPSGRSNRSGRSQADHDVFEGLPIKQWRQSETTVGLPQVVGDTKPGDNSMPELALPRDSHLLSPWTQALLREARRPRLAKRKDPTEDEKGEEEEEGEKEMQTGFLAKKWAHVPAHLEEPEREYIAKRRKGLQSLHTTLALQAAISLPATTATRKAKVMRADAEGKTTIYEVLIPEGQVVEGEVQQDTEMPDAAPERAVPGTVIEGVGIANAEGVIVANDLLQPQPPPRRRNMPPKRVKKGGPGRGKKKVMFTAEGQAGTSTPGGTGAPTTPATGDGGAGEPMDVDSARKDDDDGEDDEDDDDDREDGEISDAEGAAQETPSRPTDSEIHSKANEPSVATKDQEETQTAVAEESQHEDEAPQAEAERPNSADVDQTAASPTQDAPSNSDILPTVEESSKSEPAADVPAEILVETTVAFNPEEQVEAQPQPSSSPDLPLAESSHAVPDNVDGENGATVKVSTDGEENVVVSASNEVEESAIFPASKEGEDGNLDLTSKDGNEGKAEVEETVTAEADEPSAEDTAMAEPPEQHVQTTAANNSISNDALSGLEAALNNQDED